MRSKASGLTAIQQMGLKYYDDFEQRIPRDEVTEAVGIIREVVVDVLQVCWGVLGWAASRVLTWLMVCSVWGAFSDEQHNVCAHGLASSSE